VVRRRSKRERYDKLHQRGEIWYTKVKLERDGRWHELTLGVRDKDEAERIREAKVKEFLEAQELPDLAGMILDKAGDVWLASRKHEVEPNTYRIDCERMVALKGRLGGRVLSSLRPDDIKAYQRERRKTVSPRTVNLETKVLRLLLTEAHLWTRFEPHFKPMREDRKGPGRALTAEEQERLFKAAMNEPNASAAYFAAVIAAETTMRGCELKGLRLADVDLINGVVRVHRVTTKTDAGERVIPLTSSAVWCFTRLLERARLLGATKPEHFLFPRFNYRAKEDTVGGYDPTRHQVSWRTGWYNLLEKAKLERLRFHDLRHHGITRLAESGVADGTLLSISGHVSRRMLDHYSHIRLEAKRAAIAKIDTFKPPVATTEAEAETATKSVNLDA
jgi:integrase